MRHDTDRMELVTRAPEGEARPTPLLFVHGAWHAAWCWERFLPYFAAAGYACYAPSLRGHGGSPGRERLRWTRLSEYVEDVAAVARGLASPPVLIGHSMGGAVVQRYVEAHPAAGVVLLASVPPFGALLAALRAARRHPLAFLELNLRLSLYPLMATPERARSMLFSADVPDDELRAHHARLQDESYLGFLDMIAMALRPPRSRRVPTLVIGGAEDRLFGRVDVGATARRYGAEAALLPGVAHDVMLEPAWRDAAERILAWLRGRAL
jgi:pimeloyl-ACP methyl ester carboxylesterase